MKRAILVVLLGIFLVTTAFASTYRQAQKKTRQTQQQTNKQSVSQRPTQKSQQYSVGKIARAEQKITGNHLFSLQWIGWSNWNDYGTAVIRKQSHGKLLISAWQGVGENYAALTGEITVVSETEFIIEGDLVTRVDHIADGEAVARTGVFHFAATRGRKYWRMREIQNPADNVVDYVDIFFETRSGAPKPGNMPFDSALYRDANLGDAEAQYALGQTFLNGNNVEMAEILLRVAAWQWHSDAQAELGLLYAGQKRYSEAEKYLKMAALVGEPRNHYNLGVLYGLMEKPDLSERYLKYAADAGHRSAQNNLGHLYLDQNRIELAEKYLQLAADQGHERSIATLAELRNPPEPEPVVPTPSVMPEPGDPASVLLAPKVEKKQKSARELMEELRNKARNAGAN